MRVATALTAASLGAVLATAAPAQTLVIRDAVVRVTVIPEPRSDIQVEMFSTHPRLPLKVSRRGDRVIVDGNLGRRLRGCEGAGRTVAVRVAGLGDVPYAGMPQLVVRTPRDVRIESGGAVFGAIGRSATVDLGNAGCGDWTVGNVEGALRLFEAGSGDMRAGSAARAKLRVTGSGDLDTGVIRGPVEVDLGGAGDVTVGSVTGALDVKIAGSGDVEVKGGRATTMSASVAGSGDVVFAGAAETLKARVAGSGDITVRQVRGPISRSVLGSGEIRVGGRQLARRP